MIERDPRQPIEFEPVTIGPRRRRFDPAMVVVAVVLIGVFAALVKPWADDGSPDTGVATTGPVAAESPAPAATPDIEAGPRGSTAETTGAALVAWDALRPAIRPHDEWGVRAVVREVTGAGPPSSAFGERWSAATDGSTIGPARPLDVQDQPVVAIGVTFPADRVPLDVRIWRRSQRGTLYWLDARALGRSPAEGGLLFAPPADDPGLPSWAPGEYRLDALIDDRTVMRFRVDIPDRLEAGQPTWIDPPIVDEVVAASEVDPTTVPPGLFVTIDRVGFPLDSVAGPPLDEAGAWLDTEAGTGRVPIDRVAVAYLPRATGIGVRLDDLAVVRSASITRLAPNPFVNAPAVVGGGIIDRRTDDPWVVFSARRGDAWAPGAYRIDVTWADASGLHAGAWHLELRPGPSAGPSLLLAMARAWARHAGTSGIVVGRAEPLEGGPRSSAIRSLALVTASAADGSASDRCSGTSISGNPEGFGLGYPVDRPVTVEQIRMEHAAPLGWTLPTVIARDVVPGLSLVVPTDGARLRSGGYQIALAGAADATTFELCVGGGGTSP